MSETLDLIIFLRFQVFLLCVVITQSKYNEAG
jgi:hypothetical protein